MISKWLADANRISQGSAGRAGPGGSFMTLRSAEIGKEYIIRGIETDDEELDAFLFSLGCYSG